MLLFLNFTIEFKNIGVYDEIPVLKLNKRLQVAKWQPLCAIESEAVQISRAQTKRVTLTYSRFASASHSKRVKHAQWILIKGSSKLRSSFVFASNCKYTFKIAKRSHFKATKISPDIVISCLSWAEGAFLPPAAFNPHESPANNGPLKLHGY